MLEAKAAQAPAVSNLSISATEDGVRAECEFSGYSDKNEHVIQLFLNRVKDDGSAQEIVYAELEASVDGQGTGCTAREHVETGVYKAAAAIKRYEGGNLAATVYTDSVLYKVIKGGDSYTITLYEKEPESGGKTEGISSREKDFKKALRKEQNKKEDKEYPVCVHEKIFSIVREADTEQDALVEEACNKCGEIFSYSYVPNSAYAAFLKEAAYAVLNAQEEEILIVTDRWMSFNQEVLDAMAARPDVAVTIHYSYGGKQYTVTVPAGADTADLADENGYCGFRYLQNLYAEEEVFLQGK